MKFYSVHEAVEFLSAIGTKHCRLTKCLAHIIYNLDRDKFDILVHTLLAKHAVPPMQIKKTQAYTGFGYRSYENCRAYTLFTPSDLLTISKAHESILANSYYLYAQEGYLPPKREVAQMRRNGVNLIFATPHEMAQEVFIYNLVPWLSGLTTDREAADELMSTFYGGINHPSVLGALRYILEQLGPVDYSKIIYALCVRDGWAGEFRMAENVGLFEGVDRAGYKASFRVQATPTQEAFNAYYQDYLAQLIHHGIYSARFYYRSSTDPDYEIREAGRDPGGDDFPSEIISISPSALVAECQSISWLKNYLVGFFKKSMSKDS